MSTVRGAEGQAHRKAPEGSPLIPSRGHQYSEVAWQSEAQASAPESKLCDLENIA